MRVADPFKVVQTRHQAGEVAQGFIHYGFQAATSSRNGVITVTSPDRIVDRHVMVGIFGFSIIRPRAVQAARTIAPANEAESTGLSDALINSAGHRMRASSPWLLNRLAQGAAIHLVHPFAVVALAKAQLRHVAKNLGRGDGLAGKQAKGSDRLSL